MVDTSQVYLSFAFDARRRGATRPTISNALLELEKRIQGCVVGSTEIAEHALDILEEWGFGG